MTTIDYFFYEIKCFNPEITDTYIGHTTNFNQRMCSHKCQSKNNKKYKLYQVIRDNGGFLNWKMSVIEVKQFNNKDEARLHEQKIIIERNPTLNINNAIINDEERKAYIKSYKEANKEKLKIYHEEYRKANRHRAQQYRDEHKEETRLYNLKYRERILKQYDDKLVQTD